MTVKVTFNTHSLFDQCGVAVYQNSDCWFKAGVEYRNEEEAWMGSVVTNHGYSDWATTMIEAGTTCIWYRLSRRESDFQLESSFDGVDFKQMRIFHLFDGGEAVNVGLLACSPFDQGSFEAVFSDIKVEDCLWEAHEI